MDKLPQITDLKGRLRAGTTARVGLGRVGSGLPTVAMLEFQLAHARARDAIHAELAIGEFGSQIEELPVVDVHSQAADRQNYLMRPDLGRALLETEAARLRAYACQFAIVVADGLSAAAVRAHAVPLIREIVTRIEGWTTSAVVVAHQARVALGDEIGEAMGADIVVVLIGERPGLSAADSLSAYVTWQPKRGRIDSERNCVSNIRPPHGLSLREGADTIVALANNARALKLTGVKLKLPSAPTKYVSWADDSG